MAVGDSIGEIVNIDVRGETHGLSKSAADIRKLAAEISNLKVTLDKNAKSTDLGIKIFREYDQTLRKIQSSNIEKFVKSFNAELAKSGKVAKTTSGDYKQVGGDLSVLSKKYESAGNSVRQFSREFNLSTKKGKEDFHNWKKDMDRNIPFLMKPKSLDHLKNNHRMLMETLNDSNKSGIANVGTFKSLETGIQSAFSRGFSSSEKFAIKVGTLKQNLDGFFNNMRLHAKNMQWTGMQMMQGITLPVLGFGALAVREFSSVNKQMLQLKKVTEFKEDYDAFGESIKKMSDNFAISRGTMTGLYRDVAALGVEGTANIELWAEEISKISVLGDMDVGKATDFVRSISAIFDEGGMEKTPLLLAKLNAIADETSLQLGDLAEAFPEVAPTMKQMGFNAEGVAAALAGMYKQGIPATEGAHALKHGMTRIIDPTKDAKEVIDQLGVSFYDMTGNASEGSKNLMYLARHLGDLTNEDRGKAISEMFGGRQSARFNALVDDMTLGWDQIEAAMVDGEITLDESKTFTSDWARSMVASGEISVKGMEDAGTRYAKAMENFRKDPSFELEQLKVGFKGLMVDLGAFIVPPLNKALGAIKRFFDALMQMPNFVKMGFAGLLIAASAVGPFIYVIAQAKNALSSFGLLAAKVLPKGFKLLSEGETGKLFADKPDREDIGQVKGKTIQFQKKYSSGKFGSEVLTKADFEAAHGSKVLEEAVEDLNRELKQQAINAGKASVATKVLKEVNEDARKVAVGKSAQKLGENGSIPGIMGGQAVNDERLVSYFAGLRDKGDEASESLAEMAQTVQNVGAESAVAAPKAGGLFSKFGGALANVGKFAKFSVITAAIAVAIGTLIWFIKEFAKHWDIIKERAQPAFDAIGRAIEKVKVAFTELGHKFSGVIGQLSGGDGGGDSTITFWQTIGDFIGNVANGIATAINFIAECIVYLWPVIEGAAYLIKDLIGFVGALVQGDWRNAMMYLAAFAYEAVRPIIAAFELISNAILWVVQFNISNLRMLAQAFEEALSWVGISTTAFTGFFDTLSGGVQSVADFNLVDYFDENLRDLPSVFNGGVAGAVGETSKDSDVLDNASLAGEEIGNELGNSLADKAKDSAADELAKADWFKEFLSAVKARIEKQVEEVKQAAINALKKAQDAEMAMYDDKLKVLDDIQKAEEKLYREQEYLQKKRELLAKRSIDIQNYQRNRALAIYEGRIDDARQLDLEHEKSTQDFNKSISEMEIEKQKELIQEARDAERAKIEIEKKAAEERFRIQEEAFNKQLDLLTEYTPKTIGEFQSMVSSIDGLLSDAGASWGESSQTASDRMFLAIKQANNDIRENFAWSGNAAITSWIAAFADSDVIAMIESMGTDAGNKFKDKFEEASGGIGELSGVGGGLPMSDFNGPMGPEIENPELPAPELEGIDFSGWTDSFFNWIAEINMTMIETIGTIASGIYMTLVSILDPIIGTFQTVFGSIGEIVSTVFSGIGSIISDIWNNIIFPIFSGIWNIINNQIIPIFLFLFDIGKWVFQGIGWAITETWNNFIKPVFETVWGWITNTLVPKFIEFKDIVVGVWDNVSEKISEVWDDKLYPIFDSIRSWITDTLIPKFSEIKETITGLWDTIKNKVTEVWDWVADKVKGFLNKIIDGVNVLIRTWNTVKGLAPWAKDSPPVGEVKGLATGGITDGPTIAGEGGYPEFVIPTDPKYKNSAISLAAKASKFVGAKYSTPSIPKGVVTGGAGGSTTIYVDTFIGEEEWFAKMAETHDVKIGKKKAMNSGSQGRVISRYNANNRGAF